MSSSITIREARLSYRRPRQASDTIRSPEDAARFFRKLIGNEARENFVALWLDARRRPIGYDTVSIGTADASLVHPREVFQGALMAGAHSIIVAHNHPSGDPSPSSADETVTERLTAAGDLLGVPLLDSLVVSDRGCVSIKGEAS